MKFLQAFSMAISSILSNKVRSFLTMLGVIIGVSAVIMLVSIGQSATSMVTEQIEGMGSNLINVSITGRSTNRTIKMDEFMELKNRYPDIIQSISPVVQLNATLKYESSNMQSSVEGALPAYQNIINLTVGSGRFLSDLDNDFRNKVAVISKSVAEELYGLASPLGKELSINGYRFKVIGILESESGSLMSSSDDKIILPLSTAQRLAQTTNIRSYYVQASSKENVDAAVAVMEDYLTQKLTDEDLFNIFSQTQLLESANTITQTLTYMLAGIAAISLLVGGIGIMNIMLVAVSERTREIGIRKAIGAKKRDILTQFLIESIVVSGLGGILGIALGVQGARFVTGLMDITATISPSVVIFAFAFSMFIGMIFGIYPANKAASLKPIDALAYE
jgi:putative ABC transport system permease protein